MKKEFKIESPMNFRGHNIPRSGSFGKYKYAFHGIGCRFDFFGFFVDYDYGENGSIEGFDLWRLSQFGVQYSELNDYIKSKKMEQDFNLAISSNEIIKSIGKYDNLFYLPKSI